MILSRKRAVIGAFLSAGLALVALSAMVVTSVSAAPAAAGLASLPTIHMTGTRQSLQPQLGSGNLTYHSGGRIMKTEVSYAIFWDPPKLQNGKATHISSTYTSLISRYFGDVGGHGLYGNNTQYYQVVSGVTTHIQNTSTFGGMWVDTSAYPASGCSDSATPGACVSDSQVRAEVSKAMSAKGWTGGLTHIFFVFTSYGEGSCSGSSCAFTAYCAYHGHFTNSSGANVIYANMPYTGTNLSACGGGVYPNGDPDADSVINVTSHEQMESVTDPNLNAWYDAAGYEIGDKCAWIFGPALNSSGADAVWNGHNYYVQKEWDNSKSACEMTGP